MTGGRLWAAVAKEFRQFFRDPVLLILVLWLYTVEVVLCSVSLSFQLKNEAVGVFDLDRSQASAELAERFDRSSSFAVRYHPGTEREARALVSEGKTRLVVVIPPGYREELARGRDAPVQLIGDGTNSMIAMTALGDARRLIAHAASDWVRQRAASAPAIPWVENQVRVWYNPDLRYAYFMVISMIALAAYFVGVIHPAATIVKEKETGTIEQLLVSPLRPGELILAKTLPTFTIGLLALGPGVLIAKSFGVPLRGDPWTFALMSAVFLVSAIGTGVLIASAVRTLQQALLVSFFVLFPVLFLSGAMTPIESMPRILQELSRLIPLRYYIEALLGVLLKGVGVNVLWPQLVWMLGLGATLLVFATALFRRHLV